MVFKFNKLQGNQNNVILRLGLYNIIIHRLCHEYTSIKIIIFHMVFVTIPIKIIMTLEAKF